MDEELYSRAKFFHLRGGIDYANLRLHHRLMMRLLHMKVKQTPESDQSEETKTMIVTYGSKVNFVDLTTLKPIEAYVKKELK